jgi:acetyl esterase
MNDNIPGWELVSDEMKAALAKSREVAGGDAVSTGGSVEEVRAQYLRERRYWNEIKPEMAVVEDFAIPGPAGAIPVRLYKPADLPGLPVLLFAHGGGYVVGSLDSHDRICRLLAERSGAAVLSIGYRLAPEHKFPAAIEDMRAALDWLRAAGANRGLDQSRVAIGGDSAGANITLATALERKSVGEFPFSGLALIYGVYDNVETASRRQFGGPAFGLPNTAMKWFDAAYSRDDKDEADPLRHPGKATDFSGLPPCHIAIAGCDPLSDDSRNLTAKFQESGVDVGVIEYPGVLHGFLHMSRMLPAADQAVTDCATAVSHWLAPRPETISR